MKNKRKLGSERIFIENDSSREERKIQEKISKWVKVEKETDRDVKVRYVRVRINEIWKR